MRKVLWSFFEIFETVVIALIAVFLIRVFIAQPFLVNGSSMEPNFHNGNYLLVDEITYDFKDPARGDVVVFTPPFNENSYYIKRIIGLPGEEVAISNKGVKIINEDEEKFLNESYIRGVISFPDKEVKLGEDEYFVMGDNRNASYDSRSWGPLKGEDIVGVVRFRLWPFDQALAIMDSPSY